jgi:hypothetical protein
MNAREEATESRLKSRGVTEVVMTLCAREKQNLLKANH